jgi:hypothetical protein
MPTETITITNYAPDRFARLEATVSAKGLKLTGNDGEAKDYGAVVDWNYAPSTEILVLTIKHGPHLHNFDDFCTEVKSWVEAQA